MALTGVFLVKILIFIFFIAVPVYFIAMLLSTIVKGAPYMISGRKAIKKIIDLSGIKPGQKAADLGSGDGRIVMAFAASGAVAYGYEINPFLVWWSRRKIKAAGLEGKAFIYQKSFWEADLSSFDAVSIYGIDYIMSDLEKKLQKELRMGSKVLANSFTFPSWQPIKKDNPVYLYEQR